MNFYYMKRIIRTVVAFGVVCLLAKAFQPTTARHRLCPLNYRLESHAGEAMHGDVCRALLRNDNNFDCPRCCTAVESPPFCVKKNTQLPCRAKDADSCVFVPKSPSEPDHEALRRPEWHGDPSLAQQYEKRWDYHLNLHDKVTFVTLLGNCEFAIFKAGPKDPCPVTYARNQSRTLGLADGPEWTNIDNRGNLRKVQLKGNVAGWNSWFHNNYGHTIHDYLPGLAWFFQNTDGAVLVLETSVTKEIVQCVFEPEQLKRVVWIQENVLVQVSGSLTVITAPHKYYYPPRMSPPLRQALHTQFAKKNMCKSSTQNEPTVIYYSRQSKKTYHGRVMDTHNEKLVVSEIQKAMNKWNIPGEVIVFNGMRKDNTPMPIKDQIHLFSSAKFVIGPHGSGLANIAWMDWSGNSKPQVLEFICTPQSKVVQNGCPWGKTYYNLLHVPTPISYHHIGFTSQSTAETTYVNIEDLQKALDVMMSTFPTRLRFMRPVEVADPDGIPFFWHVPKAAGSYANFIFDRGYKLKPHADIGVPRDITMFIHRMEKKLPTTEDAKLATEKCSLIRSAREKVEKAKWPLTRFNDCTAKLSLSQPEHLCLPDCLGFLQTPLLYGAAAIFDITPRKARVATILREPISRFVSQFNYLKTAIWERTYTPTLDSIDTYVQKGNFEKSWMVQVLSNCKTEVTTDSDLNVAKEVLSRMLVGFTDNMAEFFDRLETYWNIPQHLREHAREGPMKQKVNVNTKSKNKTSSPSPATLKVLRHELRHDIALFKYAKDVLWDIQKDIYV